MRNSTLLTSGMIAGPLFIIVSLILAFTREGFDLVRHPASLLALGHLGWIQIANFVESPERCSLRSQLAYGGFSHRALAAAGSPFSLVWLAWQ